MTIFKEEKLFFIEVVRKDNNCLKIKKKTQKVLVKYNLLISKNSYIRGYKFKTTKCNNLTLTQ